MAVVHNTSPRAAFALLLLLGVAWFEAADSLSPKAKSLLGVHGRRPQTTPPDAPPTEGGTALRITSLRKPHHGPPGHRRPSGASAASTATTKGSSSSASTGMASPPLGLIGVLDFECTCEPGWGYIHEIIEFPVVLVDAASHRVVGEFHSYVRPTENATLSAFCTELTGIEQATVDAAPTLDAVLDDVDGFLRGHGCLERDASFALATDGWDLRHFLDTECGRKGIRKHAYLNRWCDLSKHFAWITRRRRKSSPNTKRPGWSPSKRANLGTMLRHYGMTFEGRPHSGIDDARNLARLALRMLSQGALRVNDQLDDPESVRRRPFPTEAARAASSSSPDAAAAMNTVSSDASTRSDRDDDSVVAAPPLVLCREPLVVPEIVSSSAGEVPRGASRGNATATTILRDPAAAVAASVVADVSETRTPLLNNNNEQP